MAIRQSQAASPLAPASAEASVKAGAYVSDQDQFLTVRPHMTACSVAQHFALVQMPVRPDTYGSESRLDTMTSSFRLQVALRTSARRQHRDTRLAVSTHDSCSPPAGHEGPSLQPRHSVASCPRERGAPAADTPRIAGLPRIGIGGSINGSAGRRHGG
jgi:hypothetical protein